MVGDIAARAEDDSSSSAADDGGKYIASEVEPLPQ